MTPWEIHEWIEESAEEHALMLGLGVPDKVTFTEGNDCGIPAGSYVQDENGIWVLES